MAKDNKTHKAPRLTRAQIAEGLEQIPMDALLLGTRTESRLTAKQKEFARQLALGNSKAAAYREAYKSKGNAKTHAANGYKVALSTEVQQIAKAYEVAIEAAKQRTPAQLRELVIHRLTKEALDDDVPPAARIQALKLLGTVSEVAAFTERKETTHVRRSEDVRAALMDKLRGLTVDAQDAVLIPHDESADSLLAEISKGAAANEQENGQPAPEPDSDQLDPTRSPPPAQTFTTLSSDLHSIPHSGTSDIFDPHSQSQELSEVIGVDEIVTPYIEIATPIVAEKVPGDDPTPSDMETPPADGTKLSP